MNWNRILLLLWLAGWGFLGLSVTARQFGPEYGVLYFFTVFPAVLFIDTIKRDHVRRRTMSGFVMSLGLLAGYCVIEQFLDSTRAWIGGVIGLILSLGLHCLFDRLIRGLAKQSEGL